MNDCVEIYIHNIQFANNVSSYLSFDGKQHCSTLMFDRQAIQNVN